MQRIDANRLVLKPWQFAVMVALYAFLSWQLFLLTSGGWSFVLYRVIGGYFFAALAISCVLGCLYQARVRMSNISMDMHLALFILLFQCVYLLLNFGDCGDQPGAYTFLEKTLKGGYSYFCSYTTASSIALYSMILMPLSYVTLLLFLVTKSFFLKNKIAHP